MARNIATPTESYPKYERPPVIERVITATAEMPEDIYQGRMEVWRAKVEPEFPVSEPVVEWRVTTELRANQVFVDPTKGELTIIPRFSKKTSLQGFDWSIRCPKGALIINMHSSPQDPRGYGDLEKEFEKWLPQWIETFEIRKFEQVTLHYVNNLNRDSVPSFYNSAGALVADRLLNIFVHIPGGQDDMIVPPLNCRVTLQLKGLEPGQPGSMAIHLMNGPDPQPSLRLDIIAALRLPPESSTASVLSGLEWCHKQILHRFNSVFTDEAKKSFVPLPP